ncbi:MAG: hypothetical protein QOF78_3938, partial [Phycisphaerales bacterium]|nr:hypothetical protein [Phycisphaerales bacterium]
MSPGVGATATATQDVHLLDDLPATTDAFGGHLRVSEAIWQLVDRESGGKAIALEGSWGSGKSTIVQMLRNRMESAGNSVFVFDAWAHEGDPLRRAFLQTLTTHVTTGKPRAKFRLRWDAKWRKLVGQTRKENSRQRPRISRFTPLILALIATYPIALLAAKPVLEADATVFDWYWIRLLLLVPVLILLVFWITLNFVTRSSKVYRHIARVLTFWMNKTVLSNQTTTHSDPETTSIEFEEYFSSLMRESVPEGKRLLIVLDNLDRVPADTAEMIWSTIRLFAETIERRSADEPWTKRVWILVPYDRDGAASLWRRQVPRADRERQLPGWNGDGFAASDTTGPNAPKQPSISAAFFDKTFQIRFVTPPLHVADWEKYLQSLIESAMPKFGTEPERHRVHRLSERLAEEKKRPPSPRHLKLYVNDIGALVRQFGTQFPIDHLALYAILRRQGGDVRLWILYRGFENDPLAQVMPDDSYIENLLAMYYGTMDVAHARTLLVRAPLRAALRAGSGESLKQLASLPGFWSVAETEFEAEFEEEDAKQDVVVNFAKALDSSGLHGAAAVSYQAVIPKFARKLLANVKWNQLNSRTAEAASQLLRVVRDPLLTESTLAGLVSGYGLDPKSFNAQEWAQGAAKLRSATTELNHGWKVTAPREVPQLLEAIVAVFKLGELGLLATLQVDSPVSDIVSAVAPDSGAIWSEEKFAAVGALLHVPSISVPWAQVVDSITTRLRADDVHAPEAQLLWKRFFDCFDRVGGDPPGSLRKLVSRPRYYGLIQESASDAFAVASAIAAAVMTNQVGRAVSDPAEQPGLDLVTSVLAKPDEHSAVVDEFAKLVLAHRPIALLPQTIQQRASLDAFAVKVLADQSIRAALGDLLSLEQFFEHFDALKEMAGSELLDLMQKALKSEAFATALDAREINFEQVHIHRALSDAGALSRSPYKSRLFEKLAEADQAIWEAEILKPGELYKLLISAVRSDFSRLDRFADALEHVGIALVSSSPPMS